VIVSGIKNIIVEIILVPIDLTIQLHNCILIIVVYLMPYTLHLFKNYKKYTCFFQIDFITSVQIGLINNNKINLRGSNNGERIVAKLEINKYAS